MSEPQRSVSEPAAAETGDESSGDRVVTDIEASVEDAGRVRTGDPEVDSVIADVASIGDRPLEEQPDAFDEAHERLRSVLDAPADDAPSDDSPA